MEVSAGVLDQKTSNGVPVDGHYEVETVYEGEDEEATLRDHYKRCSKSERHAEYTAVSEFRMEHLPLQYRTERMLEIVKVLVKLTVLLKVNGTSDKRAEYFPDTDKNAYRRGSGCVVEVWEYPNEWNEDAECPCDECQKSGKPRKMYAEIEVETAAHVVFDMIEAKNTTCYFDYDSESTALSSCCTLRTAIYTLGQAEDDVSEMYFVTHDMNLARQLKEAVGRYWRLCDEMRREHGVEIGYGVNEENLLHNICVLHRRCQNVMEKCRECVNRWRDMIVGETFEDKIRDGDEWRKRLSYVSDVYERYGRCMADVSDLQDKYHPYVEQHGVQWLMDKYCEHCNTMVETGKRLAACTDDGIDDFIELLGYITSYPLTLIVSHPHGLSKQISMGQIITRNPDTRYAWASYTYTATTCPGSSGAPVYILGRVRGWGDNPTCPHSYCVQNDASISAVIYDF